MTILNGALEPFFSYRDHTLYCEDVRVDELSSFGTPLYIYSASLIRQQCRLFKQAFSADRVDAFYAVKANSNLNLLKIIFTEGFGADIVSGGELARCLACGLPGDRIVYSGVGKTQSEIEDALHANIKYFIVESLQELQTLNEIGLQRHVAVPVNLRVNPNIVAPTHPKIATGSHINKFGIDQERCMQILDGFNTSFPGLSFCGLSSHIGSQIVVTEPYKDAAVAMQKLVNELRTSKHSIGTIGLGGGFAIAYDGNHPPSFHDYSEVILGNISADMRIAVEPGRSLIGNSGILLTSIINMKQTPAKNFAIVDASMSELLRPAMYDAYHEIVPVNKSSQADDMWSGDIVGPVCESADILAQNRSLDATPKRNDLYAILSAGAYGFSMSSNYNTRPRPAEVLVDGTMTHLIRKREAYSDLWQLEL